MRTDYTLKQLEYFVTVGELSSITKAAEKLNISPPSVSASVMKLEETLGVSLFVRKQVNGVSLTAAGKRLFEKSKRLLKQAEELPALIGDIAGSVSGAFYLGCLQTIAPYILPSLRSSFESIHPEVAIWQTESDQADLLAQLQDDALDACLTYDLRLPPTLAFHTLSELPAYVMLPPTHPLAKHTQLTPQQLRDEKLILLDLPISGKYFMSLFQHTDIKPTIADRCRDMALVRSMVANGFGYGLGNLPPKSDLSPDGKPIVHIPLKGGLRPMRLGLATAQAPLKQSIIDAFVAHCQGALAAERRKAG